MSIRLWSDGHSFPGEQLQAWPEGDPLRIELLSPRTTLVPASAFRPEEAEAILHLAGLGCCDSEQAVWSEEVEGRVVVMAIDTATLNLLPAGKAFTSPLVTLKAQARHTVLLARYGSLLYVKIWEEELRLAEVIRTETEEDLLYYLTRLGEVISLRGYSLEVAGDEPRKLSKLVKNLFK